MAAAEKVEHALRHISASPLIEWRDGYLENERNRRSRDVSAGSWSIPWFWGMESASPGTEVIQGCALWNARRSVRMLFCFTVLQRKTGAEFHEKGVLVHDGQSRWLL
jgi:hypothetical protein